MKAYILAYATKLIFWILYWTYEVEISGLGRFLETAKKERCILMLWHNRLGLAPNLLHQFTPRFRYAAFISKSRDGEPLAIITNSYDAGRAIRVPAHNRHYALKLGIETLRRGEEILVVTPDGPRGPLYRAKQGIALAAHAAQAHIVPLTWTADRCWRLKTWDQFIIPKPFARIQVSLKEPIKVSDELYPDIETFTKQLEKALSE